MSHVEIKWQVAEQAERDYWTIAAMMRYGGSFVKTLGMASQRADRENLARIKNAFPEYWEKYEKEGIELELKDIDLKIKTI